MKPDNIQELIEGYLGLEGVVAAILVSDQGLVINCVQNSDLDADIVCALVIDAVAAAQRFGKEVRAGQLDTLTMEYGRMSILVAPVNAEVMLALIAAPGTFIPTGTA